MSKKIRLGRKSTKKKINYFFKTVDLDENIIQNNSQIILYGNTQAVIDGCYGIIEYSDSLVKINIGNKVLVFSGVDFNISDYTCSSITVRGNILNISFE